VAGHDRVALPNVSSMHRADWRQAKRIARPFVDQQRHYHVQNRWLFRSADGPWRLNHPAVFSFTNYIVIVTAWPMPDRSSALIDRQH
jgi:hypothetical protein